MSSGRSDMARSVLGTALSSLLLLASITQGLRDVEVIYNEKMEAAVGQNVTLPCTLKANITLKVASIEWSKNDNTKLALFSQMHGPHLFWPNVSQDIENNTMGSHLQLSGVTTWDSGIYICDLTTFPLGSIRRQTRLTVRDIQISCDADSIVEVNAGENVTIRCRPLPDARYRWTKDETLVSESSSLELLWVTGERAGVYTLTVDTGNTRLHKEFTITLLTATASWRTDLESSSSPRPNVTEEGLIESTQSGRSTSPTAGPSTTDIPGTARPVTTDSPADITFTAGENATSHTPSPLTHTDADYLENSTNWENTSASNLSTTGITELRPTQGTGNESVLHTADPQVNASSPDESSTAKSYENPDVVTIEDKDAGLRRSHLFLVLITVPLLVLIAVAAILYRKQKIKQRMDLPPPFKPPPPPVKYTAVRHREVSLQRFPTSRCNSVSELKDMRETFIDV